MEFIIIIIAIILVFWFSDIYLDNRQKRYFDRFGEKQAKIKDEQERLNTEKKIREKIYKEKLEKERIEIENAKKTLTVLEAAEIARTALKKLRISDLKDLIPFVQTEEQLNELISDFHNELLPVYEEIMNSYGIKKNLVGNKRFSELLEYCLEFGKTAIRKIPEITLEHKPLDERTLKSESTTKEREIKKVASWAEIKKKIDDEK
jgi:hypothetical protein